MDFIKSYASSAAAITITYPLDTISRQYQVTSSTTKVVTVTNVRSIKTLYSGLPSALITQPVFWGSFFPLYNELQSLTNQNGSSIVTGVNSLLASSVAVTITNPLWVIRQRLQTRSVTNSNSSLPIMKEIYAEAGLKTFMRGTSVTLIKNGQMFLLMPIFEKLNGMDWKRFGVNSMILSAALSGSLAKIVSSTLFYPLDVIRTNMRVIKHTTSGSLSIRNTVTQITSRPGGWRNLFRGISWYWMNSAAVFGLMMAIRQH
jgi:hypothetical protein